MSDAIFQDADIRQNITVSPLSLRERVRVRALLAVREGHAFDAKYPARKSMVIYRLRH